MIRHIVLLQVKANLGEKEVDFIFESLKNLKKTILQIASFSWGPYSSPENLNRGYNYCFVMEFKNSADRNYYLEHRDHVQVATEIVVPALERGINSALAFDYEVLASHLTRP